MVVDFFQVNFDITGYYTVEGALAFHNVEKCYNEN